MKLHDNVAILEATLQEINKDPGELIATLNVNFKRKYQIIDFSVINGTVKIALQKQED